ncbi:MAG: FAD:protein FMN transferase, partial [Deltaproteobacteria bacterium]|nr:FAD:protein FMN transferase [Deltaproteobacteria bacterium]
MKTYPQLITVLIILLGSMGVAAQQEHLIAGRTMGTTYHIKVAGGDAEDVGGLKEKIERRLLELNQVFSTYIKDSEISRFNALQRAG